jgi:hypothetical protein
LASFFLNLIFVIKIKFRKKFKQLSILLSSSACQNTATTLHIARQPGLVVEGPIVGGPHRPGLYLKEEEKQEHRSKFRLPGVDFFYPFRPEFSAKIFKRYLLKPNCMYVLFGLLIFRPKLIHIIDFFKNMNVCTMVTCTVVFAGSAVVTLSIAK